MSDAKFPYNEIFSRNIGAISPAQQQLLQEGRVAVVGCGGLGGHVIEQLVRLGVGSVHCFDPDVFTPSNGNRQLNATRANLGKNKAQAAVERAAAIHRHSLVVSFPEDFRSCRSAEAFAVDLVVDCLDSVSARRDLAALCGERNLPLVHGAVNGWCGQVGVVLPGGDLLDRLYRRQTESAQSAAPSVLACTVALVASLQVAEVLKLLLGQPTELAGSWLHVDLKYMEFLLNR